MASTTDIPPSSSPDSGIVYLVGAGPGAPELLTLRGVEVLSIADDVLYDYLVNPQILRHARAEARCVCLGQHGRTRIWSQQEINERLVELARAGRRVVRLKGGDPSVFGRSAQELDHLIAHGIPFEVVPGVTAASAVAAYTGIPLTDRDVASCVALGTGQGRGDDVGEPLDFARLSAFPGTLVVYMGVTTAGRWVQQLVRGGRAPDTPAAIVRRCSYPDQSVRYCALVDVPRVIEGESIRPPVLVVVGEAVRASRARSWFEKRPLFGKRVLVTRAAGQAEDLGRMLRELGADVRYQPAITIGPPADAAPLDEAIGQLHSFAWVVFSSANGVRYFLDRVRTLGRDWRALGACRLAVIGPATRRTLAEYGFEADLQPDSFVAEELASALQPHVAGERVLLVRAGRGREVLAESLRAVAREVVQVVAYDSRDVTHADPAIAAALDAGHVDWITVTSSAIAHSLVRLFGDRLRRARLVSISPVTSAALAEHGLVPAAEAATQTMEGIVQAILKAES